MFVCIYVYKPHIHSHRYIHACKHAQGHIYIHASLIHACINPCIHTYTHTYTHTHIHTHTCTAQPGEADAQESANNQNRQNFASSDEEKPAETNIFQKFMAKLKSGRK